MPGRYKSVLIAPISSRFRVVRFPVTDASSLSGLLKLTNRAADAPREDLASSC